MVKAIVSFALLLSLFGHAQQKEQTFVEFQTNLGSMVFELLDDTPKHKAAFLKGIKSGIWDNQIFNRVIPNFVIQGGCPDTPEGFNNPELLLEAEIHKHHKHVYGMLGFGRDDNPEKKSAICQLYIVNTNAIPHLDGHYSLFGKMVSGEKVLNQISDSEVDKKDIPLDPIVFKVVLLQ